jgi:hypothetical protein
LAWVGWAATLCIAVGALALATFVYLSRDPNVSLTPAAVAAAYLSRLVLAGFALAIVGAGARLFQHDLPAGVRLGLAAALVLPSAAAVVFVLARSAGHPYIGAAVAMMVVSALPAFTCQGKLSRWLAAGAAVLIAVLALANMRIPGGGAADALKFFAGVGLALPQAALALWGLVRGAMLIADPDGGLQSGLSNKRIERTPRALS